MNKKKFFTHLKNNLTKLPHEERQEILQDYEEYFAIGQLDGKSEEQIATSLGSPKTIGKELSAAYHLEKAETTGSTGNLLRAIWAVIGLGFFNLIIVLGPFIALVALIVSGWVTGIGFTAAPLLILLNPILAPGTFELFDLFNSLALCGLGLFISIGMLYATKYFMNGFIRYMKFNGKLVKGGLTHVEH
ncbi:MULTISPECIES: HAAS signaling domain-containing protein [unclassified Sporosarcina]|uniref:HAAS signaling domain-containing protein n=1 Tax=unclassified Sporosarcina TaxID=2647733 RepID=UPI0030FA4A49